MKTTLRLAAAYYKYFGGETAPILSELDFIYKEIKRSAKGRIPYTHRIYKIKMMVISGNADTARIVNITSLVTFRKINLGFEKKININRQIHNGDFTKDDTLYYINGTRLVPVIMPSQPRQAIRNFKSYKSC